MNRREAVDHAVSQIQNAATDLQSLADALGDDNTVSPALTDYDNGPFCRLAAGRITALVTQAAAVLARVQASAGMLEAIAYVPIEEQVRS